LKFLLIGSNYSWSIERIYKRELEALGHQVELHDVQNQFYDYYYKSIFHKLIYRLGFSRILEKINKALISKVSTQYYDFIWVFKGMEIYPETLRLLKSKSKQLVNFNPDNPFIFSGKGSGNKNVTKSITLFDLHFTYDAWVKNKIESTYNIKTELLPFGFDDEAISGIELNLTEEVNAVCFLGNPDDYRASIIKSLLDNQIEVHLYGNNWDRFIKHKNAFIHEPVYGLDFYKTLRKYRIQLNIMRVHNLNSHNMRSIEIPGSAGVMLAPKTADHTAFFHVGKEIFVYEDSDSLANEAQHILNLDKSVIDKIRIRARSKVIENFTYKVQTKRILHLLNEA
jgi:spore maturation protein CgeB